MGRQTPDGESHCGAGGVSRSPPVGAVSGVCWSCSTETSGVATMSSITWPPDPTDGMCCSSTPAAWPCAHATWRIRDAAENCSVGACRRHIGPSAAEAAGLLRRLRMVVVACGAQIGSWWLGSLWEGLLRPTWFCVIPSWLLVPLSSPDPSGSALSAEARVKGSCCAGCVTAPRPGACNAQEATSILMMVRGWGRDWWSSAGSMKTACVRGLAPSQSFLGSKERCSSIARSVAGTITPGGVMPCRGGLTLMSRTWGSAHEPPEVLRVRLSPARGALQGRIYCANKTVTQKKSWQQRGHVSQFIVTIARVSSSLPVLNGLNPTD